MSCKAPSRPNGKTRRSSSITLCISRESRLRTVLETVSDPFLTNSWRQEADTSWQSRLSLPSTTWSRLSQRCVISSTCRWWPRRLSSPSSAACRVSTSRSASLKRNLKSLKRSSLMRLCCPTSHQAMHSSAWTLSDQSKLLRVTLRWQFSTTLDMSASSLKRTLRRVSVSWKAGADIAPPLCSS